ncbi:MAG: hypothetical protein P8L74_00375 [Gammaproteobacteria bacterium]|nr:hypothetical protein [Gammaproteobacteria bacterium]
MSHAIEHKAFACYNKASANTDRFLEYELVLSSDGDIDGLKNDTSGTTTVNNSDVKWRFTGNFYYWDIFSHKFQHHADIESFFYKGEAYRSKWKRLYCDRVDATLFFKTKKHWIVRT